MQQSPPNLVNWVAFTLPRGLIANWTSCSYVLLGSVAQTPWLLNPPGEETFCSFRQKDLDLIRVKHMGFQDIASAPNLCIS